MITVLADAAVSLLLLASANQQMYEGPRRPPAEVAILKPAAPSLAPWRSHTFVAIMEIDGSPPRHKVTMKSPVYEILPGRHRIRATLSDYSMAYYVPQPPSKFVEFDAKVGETYTISYRWPKGEAEWILFVTEDRSGATIAEN